MQIEVLEQYLKEVCGLFVAACAQVGAVHLEDDVARLEAAVEERDAVGNDARDEHAARLACATGDAEAEAHAGAPVQLHSVDVVQCTLDELVARVRIAPHQQICLYKWVIRLLNENRVSEILLISSLQYILLICWDFPFLMFDKALIIISA